MTGGPLTMKQTLNNAGQTNTPIEHEKSNMCPVSSVLMTMENGIAGGCEEILLSSARIRVGLCIMESRAQLAAWYSVHHTPLVPHNTLHPGTNNFILGIILQCATNDSAHGS